MAWKYIMVENKLGDIKVLFPVIFPDKMVHSDVFAHIKSTMPGFHVRGGHVKVVSAGKIEHLTVYGLGGDSETLQLSADKRDAAVIASYSYTHGVT